MMKTSKGRKLFMTFNYIFMIFFMASILYPFLNVLAISFSQGQDAAFGQIHIMPRVFSTEAYKTIFENAQIFRAFRNSVSRTIIGTITGLSFTAGLAYILSKKNLVGRRYYIFIFVLTMYLSGGMIPNFILMTNLGLIDNFLVYIIPQLLNVWNMMVMRAYFEEIPDSLTEAAEINGANGFQIFTRIILPVSKPVLATVALFIAVSQWNSWYDTYVYTSFNNLLTLQGLLIKILMESQADILANDLSAMDIEQRMQQATPETIKMATIIISTLPIVMVYPYLQKHFVKGIMVGAVKG